MPQPKDRRQYMAACAAACCTMAISLIAMAGSLYFYISYQINGYFPWNGTITEGPDELFTPVMSSEGYQEVLLLCAVCGYGVWFITAVVLLVGVCQTKQALYVPWLSWTGFMLAACLFAIFHNLAFEYIITKYVLAEYVVFAFTVVFTFIFGLVVYTNFNSQFVRSMGHI